MSWLSRLVPAVLAVLAASAPAVAQTPGVTDAEIRFGQSAAFAGPARRLGADMRAGIRAAFEEANRAGGVHGRKLALIAYDDGYEPEAAIDNVRRLIKEDRVFALIGSVGTPTSRATEPIASRAGVPFVGAFTGAELLRVPYRPTVVNVRASYFQETEEIVARLTGDLDARRIAVLYQDDSYGRAGLEGVRRALGRRGLAPAAQGAYMRNTVAVKSALLAIRRGDPQAVVIIGAYAPAAAFIKWARKLGLGIPIFNISFVGATALAAALGPVRDGVFVTQVVPSPDDPALPLVRQYRRALDAVGAGEAYGFVSLEGYLAGRVAIAALEHAGRVLNRTSFLARFASAEPMRIGSLVLRYGPADNQGLDRVFLTRMRRDGGFEPVTRLSRP